MKRTPFALALLTAAITPHAMAETATELDSLIITSPRTTTNWLQSPISISAVDASEKPGEQSLTLDTLLAPVPGTVVQSRYNAAQGMRLSIRGFGSRSSFGVRGVRVLVDGVPLTMPDGQTEMDGVDSGLVERIEVIRGPASTIYGNAAGGVLAIQTREPGVEPYSAVDISAGELGYRRTRAETSGTVGNLGGLLAFNSTQLDGFRDHGRAEANSLTGKVRWQTEAGRLGINLNALDNRSEDPGALSLAQVKASRSNVRPAVLQYDSDERIRQQRLAVLWEGYTGGPDTYQVRSYVGQRNFGNRLPISNRGMTSYDRLFAGVGAQYTHHANWFGLPQKITGGVDLESQRDDRDRHTNLSGETGALTLEQRERAESRGIFLEDEITLADRWLMTLGVRRDSVLLKVEDHYLSDGDNSDKQTLSDWNYSWGLSYQLDDHHVIYGRYATSFETPTTNELANPTSGGFNTSLGSADAVNREIGLKGEWPNVHYEIALYSMRLEDELVPYTIGSSTYYTNAGKSSRDGLEASLDWQSSERWRWSAAYSYNRYRFTDFTTTAGNYDGNRIAGIPRQTLFSELAYDAEAWYTRVNVQAFGHQYADNANQARVAGYALVNARLGARFSWQGQTFEPYVGLDNLFNRDYYDNLRINDSNGFYYEPAPGRTLYAGVKLSF
ncbi:TonB-dependent receptor family protein [Pseudomonas sp. LRF_L74]|uniref:TonB-dependent receptor family protein n=1 Tax=Pseudomonas sp. LRF_L74 TaxID=3369422 RepID=UPI003F62B658